MSFEVNLTNALQAAQIPFDAQKTEQLTVYHNHLLCFNEHTNLTAITDPDEMIQKHYIDSLLGLSLLPKEGKLVDVGCGAGLPSMPLKIFAPQLSVTLLDASQKRLRFLEEVIQMLSLENIVTHHARAEDAGHDKALRASFDVAVSRAVASLPTLLEYCLPLVKAGGKFLAYKGPGAAEEIALAQGAMQKLGCKLEKDHEFSLSDGSSRHLLVFEKIGLCAPAYPRSPKQIKNKPL